ncbi:ATP-binding protein, partial [Planktothrix sp. FACHB-1355]
FPDLSTLNAHASDAVFQAIQQVSSGEAKVTSLAITAEKGVGKTHLLSRIRHYLQAHGSALFIYAGANRFTHSDLLKYQFLQILSDSLNQVGSQGVKQWQELATAMLNIATEKQNSPKDLIEKKFSYALAKNKNLIDHLTASIIKNHPNSDPDIIRAILWTLSESNASYAIKWLSGNDLSEAKAAELGLPNIDKEQREANAFESVLQILTLLSDYKPVVICFDELEIVNLDEGSFHKPEAVAGLVKNIFDSLNLLSTSKGVVILTVMMPDTWKLKIKKLSGGIPDRLSSAATESIELRPMDGDSIVQLVTLWLKDFYRSKNLVPHHPLYPFTENQLRQQVKEKPPVRKVLQWCATNFQVSSTSSSDNGFKQPDTPPHPVEVAFSKEMTVIEQSIDTLMEDKATLADALRWGFQSLIKLGETIEEAKVYRLEEIEPKKENSGYIDFKILVKQNAKAIKIGVAVLQQSSTHSVLAGLRRLIAFKTFGIHRSCLVRAKEINPGATQAQECLNKLISSKRGEWVPLKVNPIKPLLAIRSVYLGQVDHGLTEKEILEFIAQRKLVINNYIIRKIISEPTGKIPNIIDLDKSEEVIIESPDPIATEKDANEKQGKLITSDLSWIDNITKLGNRSKELDEGKSNYQAGTDFENIVRRSLEFIGFTINESYKGGAGGLDLFCSKPYPLAGECKAGRSIPDRTVEELDRIGKRHLKENYMTAVRLIIGPGEPTKNLRESAEVSKVSIIKPMTLQKLVELQAKYPGSVNLIELKPYLEAGQIDSKIHEYIEKVLKDIRLRSHIVEAVKQLGEAGSGHLTAEVRVQYNAVFKEKEQTFKPEDLRLVHELLLELSSPLTGYLGRKKGSDWQSDRFCFLRDLPIE